MYVWIAACGTTNHLKCHNFKAALQTTHHNVVHFLNIFFPVSTMVIAWELEPQLINEFLN